MYFYMQKLSLGLLCVTFKLQRSLICFRFFLHSVYIQIKLSKPLLRCSLFNIRIVVIIEILVSA